MPGRYFIKTFGCQMNEYDSARMADALHAADGLTATDDPAEADVLLMNTCSVREKAQEKVFSLLGEWRHAQGRSGPHVLIGVGGCVASQEGEAITERAPFVDLVFGPQTLHRLPDMIAELRRTGRSVVDVSFPEIEKFDRLPAPRAEGATAFVSIMEGCSKYCSFCIVPYTRGDEVSRPFESTLTEDSPARRAGRARSDAARPERECLRRADGGRRHRRSRHAHPSRRGGAGHRAHPLHHFASARVHRQPHRGLRERAEAREPPAPAGAERLRSRARAHEARLHGARIQGEDPQAARRAARTSASPRISSSASPARPSATSKPR